MSLTNRLIFLVWLGYSSCVFAQSPAGKTDFNVADRLAIQNVISSHFLNLDSNQIDAWIANYADKATFIAVVSGKRYSLKDLSLKSFSENAFANSRRTVINDDIWFPTSCSLINPKTLPTLRPMVFS